MNVKEYAARCGVSRERIYQLLKAEPDRLPWIIVVNGQYEIPDDAPLFERRMPGRKIKEAA